MFLKDCTTDIILVNNGLNKLELCTLDLFINQELLKRIYLSYKETARGMLMIAITIALQHRVLNLDWLNHVDDCNNYSLAASSLEFRLVESC